MQALRYHFNEKIRYFTSDGVSIPTAEKAAEVPIRVLYAGLCGTDIHIIKVSRIWKVGWQLFTYLFTKQAV